MHEELKLPVNNIYELTNADNLSNCNSSTEEINLINSSNEELNNRNLIKNRVDNQKQKLIYHHNSVNNSDHSIQNDLKANNIESISNLFTNSIDDYLVNENSKQITPGLGDVNEDDGKIDHEYLNSGNNEKENDLNKSNKINCNSFQNHNSHCTIKEKDDDQLNVQNNNNVNGNDEQLNANGIDENNLINFDYERDSNDSYGLKDGEEGLKSTAGDLRDLSEVSDDEAENNESITKQDNLKKDKKKEKIIYESIISQMFDGEILNSVQCLTCQNVSTIKETFQDLSLPIPNKEDLQQTRQVNNYLKSLENDSYSALSNSKQQLINESATIKVLKQSDCMNKKNNKKRRLKNGYKRLANEELEEEAVELLDEFSQIDANYQLNASSRLKRRIVRLPLVKFLILFLLYINYFCKAYILYFLLSIYYWSQTNLWGPTITLNDCLNAFFSTDELKDNNMYSCEKCKKLRNGIKFTNLVKSPDILCIHFKRFRNELMFPSKISTYVAFPLKHLNITSHLFDDDDQQTGNQSLKSNNLIQFNNQSSNKKENSQLLLSNDEDDKRFKKQRSISLNETPFDLNSNNSNNYLNYKRKNEIYDLVSVICHRGHYNSGHYITYALNCLDECWYEYDDKSVRKVDESKVLNCEAYVLFFKKNLFATTEIVVDEDSNDDNINNRFISCNEEEQLLNAENQQASSKSKKLSSTLFKDFKQHHHYEDENKRTISLTRGEMFRKRKYDKYLGKIDGDLDYLSRKENDILGDLKL